MSDATQAAIEAAIRAHVLDEAEGASSTSWRTTVTDDPETICAGMGCKHPRKAHTEWGACSTKRAFFNEVLYGYEQPLIYKTCMCPWMEPIPPAQYKVKDNPQS